MAADIKPGWSKPSTILFAADYPADEKAFTFALAQASEFNAELILFHVFDGSDLPASAQPSLVGVNDFAAVRTAKLRLESLCRRAKDLGVRCKVVVRQGWPAERILSFLRERKIDRVVMGAHSPGPVGKLLVGSVAEAVLRNAIVPVCIVGPHVAEDSYRSMADRKILCDVSKPGASRAVATFGAELALGHGARLVLHRIVSPHESAETVADRSSDQLEAELKDLVPALLQQKVSMRTKVAFGDPIEELLYQGRSQRAHMIVLGAHGASQFAAVSRAGAVYKILSYAQCPVLVLSPVLLAELGEEQQSMPRVSSLHYVAGVI
jgi:nucleotide-binding universal stress UspA family protein